jgi:beta-lactamase class D
MNAKRFSLAMLSCLLFASCADTRIKEHEEWGKHFKEYGISNGCFILRDQTHETIHYYNKDRCLERFSPASTFKIFNSLVALETSVAPDEQLVIPWDSVERMMPEWNKDMDMREAFAVSSVPYYQELARRIGAERMQHFLDTAKYGNMKMGPRVDSFWLDNSLQISADEQVGLVKRLYFGELKGFSERSQRIVRSLMLREETAGYRLYYKTGWGDADGKEVMWVTGFAERIVEVQEHKQSMNKSNVRFVPTFFALNFEIPQDGNARDWMQVRIELLRALLKDFGAI